MEYLGKLPVYGKHPCEQNGKLSGVSDHSSTPQELADFLNSVAVKAGIAKSETNPDGYWATPESLAQSKHEAECRYLGNDSWDCGHMDNAEYCDCHICDPEILDA